MTHVTTRRSFRPGTWFGVFGEHATVLLPGSEKARVAGLWELVDDGAHFDEVLDALISGGLRELPGFVLVSDQGTDTKVVVRGAARAVFVTEGEQVELAGSQATTWVERSLPSVTAMRVDLEDASGAELLSIGTGLVRVSRVEVGAPVGAGDAGDPPGPEPELEPEPVSTEDPAPPVSDHDGHTRTGEVDAGSSIPGFGQPPPGPAVTSRPVARLAFSNGDTVEIDRTVIVGRAPEARRFPAAEQPRLVSVPSPHQEVSSTHAEFRPGSGADHGSAVVTDLGSTNGTVLVQPGLPPEDLQPGIAVQLVPGAIVDLGDSVTIQVLNP